LAFIGTHKGVATGDFSEAPAALLGLNAQGLSAKTITPPKVSAEERHIAILLRHVVSAYLLLRRHI